MNISQDKKAESWKYKLEKDIDLCMKKSNNKFEFFKKMNSLGYKVTWTKERKNITLLLLMERNVEIESYTMLNI